MTNQEILEKYEEIVGQLNDIIWWCQTAQNPIYDVDKNGKRHARDLYQIRDGFIKAYRELKETL